MVIFACELIPATGAPTASVDLIHETREKSVDLIHKTHEKAADAHNTTSSVCDILNYFASSSGGFRHAEPHRATKIAAGAPMAGIISRQRSPLRNKKKFKIY
jgi:hypothetical protein